MEHTISTTEAVLLDLLSEEQLALVRDDEGVKAALKAKADAKAKEDSLIELKELLATIDLPTPPDGVYNLYIPFQRGMRPLGSGEREDYLKTHPTATTQELDAKLIETDEFAWGDWVINKPLTFATGGTRIESRTRKLAVTVSNREGNLIVPLGNFRTSREACEFLGLDEGKASARAFLGSKQYIVDNYDGNDFLVKQT